jgi:hypothetical protein
MISYSIAGVDGVYTCFSNKCHNCDNSWGSKRICNNLGNNLNVFFHKRLIAVYLLASVWKCEFSSTFQSNIFLYQLILMWILLYKINDTSVPLKKWHLTWNKGWDRWLAIDNSCQVRIEFWTPKWNWSVVCSKVKTHQRKKVPVTSFFIFGIY